LQHLGAVDGFRRHFDIACYLQQLLYAASYDRVIVSQ
jgi:hypothetical protein